MVTLTAIADAIRIPALLENSAIIQTREDPPISMVFVIYLRLDLMRFWRWMRKGSMMRRVPVKRWQTKVVIRKR